MRDLIESLDKLVDTDGFAGVANMSTAQVMRLRAKDPDFPANHGTRNNALFKTGEIRAYLKKRRAQKNNPQGAQHYRIDQDRG